MSDAVIIEAYEEIVRQHHCSADRILENPTFRTEFLELARRSLADPAEEPILHRLTALRKAGKLKRSRDLDTDSAA
jgi:hypothetical protein